ncbi:hypothetical protein RRG08_019381 [Elysia crispata]|uniref:Uncharacterized protein n=1 Tax=Elysia crispata TaxID=231223 RepID=A0AAE0XT72_9GAST|nr:hypothetical protein RRG08_019381 [Elysia crispata]
MTSRLLAGLLMSLLAAMVVSSAGSNPINFRDPPISCAQCDTEAIPPAVFERRYLGTCMRCGEMYGSEIAHCCVCHEKFTELCKSAMRKHGGSQLSPTTPPNDTVVDRTQRLFTVIRTF